MRPKPSRIAPLERFLFTLHGFLKDISPVNPSHPLEAARKLLKKGVAVPYSLPLPAEDTNWKVSFTPPTEIALVGSWANKVSVKAKDSHPFGVDLAVEMPDVRQPFPEMICDFHSKSFSGSLPGERLFERTVLPQKSVLSCHHCRCYSKSQI